MLIVPRRKQEVLLKCNLFGVVEKVKVLSTLAATSSVRQLMNLDKACQVLWGSMIRDGKIAVLDYESWHKVPDDVKEMLWTLAKSKYDLDDSSKKWVMQKHGKQLNSWTNRVKKNCFKGKEDLPLRELQKSKDSRVFDSQFEKLVKQWSSEQSKEMSRRNKITRSHRIHNHTTGTKSFARVAKEKEKASGRPPTRAEMFKYVMTSKNGTKSEATKNAIAKMAEKENENPELPTQGCSKNDLFAQIMGLDRNGRVRMYGAGVSPSMVFNNARSGANQIATIKSLQEHNKKLLDEVEHWKSMANGQSCAIR